MVVHNKDKQKAFNSSARLKVIILLILLCFAFLLLNNNGLVYLFKAKQKNTELIEKKMELESKEENLLNEKEMLQSDKKHIEKKAREQYNMVKPGEKVYKVIEEEDFHNRTQD